ncbi:methyltransferase domain-containing protein [Bradyrhizobium hipponense]|uniref:Methyltransferase domain-containing protein n=1 Tax=Bradyrhizobium hipponense TaxID=2605638 RepID=A0A5S4YC91_9BRAD|nr:methyltransferase domain-containing protein [Bradyrhizobium hipponense]TYO60865.1 methyltransferase domain-containing protein [Bradyrhizobium hipponense]
MQVTKKRSFGSFSDLAEFYPEFPPYSRRVLQMLFDRVKHLTESPIFADIGAGTGLITYALADMGLSGYAVEPDSQMVAVGQRLGPTYPAVSWVNAPGECTGLAEASLDWVCYSMSFHLTNSSEALRESMRILRPRGFFTIATVFADLETDPFQLEIENRIRDMAPALRRALTPLIGQMGTYEALLNQYPGLGNCISLATTEAVSMSEERYLNYWRGRHDIPSQVSSEVWNSILQMIAETFRKWQPASLRFRSRAWHAQRG